MCLVALISACSNGEKKEQTVSANRWYMNSIIYNVEVRVFKDSDGDGIGDFNGLTQKIPYLKSLGVDAVWLAPFQPTSYRDDGYDVMDYYGIDTKTGTKEDFDSFIKAAHKAGIKVVMDVVLNHTSNSHPWYQKARLDSTSKYFNWYVWSKAKPKNFDEGMAFPGVQNETWTYDEVAKRYYFHRFYDFQPDLNFENKEVQAEGKKILTYWLNQGLDGFRLDAVPFIIDKPAEGDDAEPMYNILSDLNATVKKLNPDAILLGEANVAPDKNKVFFGENGSRLQLMFNFYANQYLFYSLADEHVSTFKEALQKTHEKPTESQWAYFMRNHDEIDLGRLSSKERNKVYEKFGPEKSMQLYDRGIRRRLAPMINDAKKLELCYSLLFSLPGTPVIRYGEEIGMGDDLTLQERLSVRTPMQWSSGANSGFTSGNKPYRPLINMGEYRYQAVNVDLQSKNSQSLLSKIKQLIAARKAHPEIGLGAWNVLDTGADEVLAIEYTYEGRKSIVVHNFSKRRLEKVEISMKNASSSVIENVINPTEKLNLSNGRLTLALNGYEYKWYSLKEQ
ncbi:trehalose synthase [Mucilaginibacter sp. HME9299]|uniref:Trehalose synthase n=1 Tax=Mucilaginibacter aquatilis TaxID=1517760 RepID=A0A6I4IA32_9SPHI|nr:trehalose synthase [Mucilaginibacter aquatilis]